MCQGPGGSDVYHLAANLLDRYLLYKTAPPKDFDGVAGACAMISMKIRRARKECRSLSYERLSYYFKVSERDIRVSFPMKSPLDIYIVYLSTLTFF